MIKELFCKYIKILASNSVGSFLFYQLVLRNKSKMGGYRNSLQKLKRKSNIEDMIDISKNVGLTVPFDDIDELINAIIHLQEDKKLYQKFSENALIKSEKYSLENIAKKYEKSFINLIKMRKRNSK